MISLGIINACDFKKNELQSMPAFFDAISTRSGVFIAPKLGVFIFTLRFHATSSLWYLYM
jgi:hypothetical protein